MHLATVGNAALCVATVIALGDARQGAPCGDQAGRDAPTAPVGAPPDPRCLSVETVEATVDAFYCATAGNAGLSRDWEAFKSLFLPEARLVVARAAAQRNPEAFQSVAKYIDQNARYFEKSGYYNRESARRIETFGGIAHVWSTFETRRIGDAAGPCLMRGINSIQLLKHQDRWWIVSVFWELERPDNPIPAEYLPSRLP